MSHYIYWEQPSTNTAFRNAVLRLEMPYYVNYMSRSTLNICEEEAA